MNYSKVVLFILVSMLSISCHRKYTKNETILRAEAILNSKPDSAQKILLSVSHPEQQLSQADYAAWCLIFTHTQYKLYQDIKSDSLIRISVNYYEDSNLPVQSGTAYYLLGCVLQLKQDNKAAMEAYKKAEDLLNKTNEDDLKGLVEFKIGYLYRLDALFAQSAVNYRKSLIYFVQSNNIRYQAFAYRALSETYAQLNRSFDSVTHYSNAALKLAKQAHDTVNYYSILAQQGELLCNTNYVRSKEYLLKGYRFFPAYQTSFAPYLSYEYSKLNKSDSARYYLNIALTDTTTKGNDRTIKYLAAAYVSKDEGKMNNAFEYLEKAYLNRDTVFQQSIHSQLHQIDKQYDFTQKENENARLKILNQQKIILISVLFIFLLILSFGILYVIDVHKKKILKIDTLNQIQQQKMEYDLKLKQTENEQKKNLLLLKVQNQIKNTLLFNRLSIGFSQADKKEAFMNMIIEQSVLTEKDWQFYIDWVDQIFDKRISRLKSTYPELSQLDLIVITLICLQLDIADSCSLLNMNKSTLYKRRNRIKERIGLPFETDMEVWLLNLMQEGEVDE
ncbi:MAG: hypothetical protein P4L34_05140 [Paludibacter sp.]|nr:hypothetical protein [Paludibacter sp.]